MTNQNQDLSEALNQFKASMKEADEALEKDFHDLFNRARKDSEEKSRNNEESELVNIDKELAEII